MIVSKLFMSDFHYLEGEKKSLTEQQASKGSTKHSIS